MSNEQFREGGASTNNAANTAWYRELMTLNAMTEETRRETDRLAQESVTNPALRESYLKTMEANNAAVIEQHRQRAEIATKLGITLEEAETYRAPAEERRTA